MKNQNKYYFVLLEWCERNGDDGTELVLMTTDLEQAKETFKKLRNIELAKNLTFRDPDDPSHPELPWMVMDDTDTLFFHHGCFPDFCSIKILELIDPHPAAQITLNLWSKLKNREPYE